MTRSLPLLAAILLLAGGTAAQARQAEEAPVATSPESPADAMAPAEAPPEPGLEPAPDAAPDEAPAAASEATEETSAAPEAPATIKLPAPEMKPGAKRRYRIADVTETTRSGETRRKAAEQVIELEVLEPKGAAPQIRYVIVEGKVEDDAAAAATLAASRGVVTDYEADATGKPLKLTDWDKVRTTILERLLLDPTAPLEGAKRVRAALTSMDGVTAIPFAVPEALMIAEMQGWGEMQPGRTDDPPQVSGAGDRQARMIAFREAAAAAEGGCTASVRRSSELDPQSPVAKNLGVAGGLDTTAEVSTVDGWVVGLKQTRTQLSGPQKMVRTWTVTREDPPACPGAEPAA